MNWDEFLTDYEAKIASTEAALDVGDPLDPAVLVPFEAPAELGRLPEAFIDRAVEMIRRSAEVGQRLENAMSVVQREMGKAAKTGRSPRSPFTDTTVPKYFDSSI